MRSDNRAANQLRDTTITPHYLPHAEGSVLIEAGRTRVICTASVEDRVPPFLRNTGKGWVTAEYGMLPRATNTRMQREATAGKVGGRTQEIQRLVGRSIRSVVDLGALGERTIWLDCDVIQADGGTRTASVTGAFVAFCQAAGVLKKEGVSYTPDTKQAVSKVTARDGHYAMGFVLRPTLIGQVVAMNGEKMPQKATYFYPKLLTGLVIRKL
jgi:ribonuclease PH